MRFCVSVPVLSEHTTLTHPNVSTLGRRFTMAFAFTIRETESASTIVTMAGSPSGTAATAREIAVISISPTSRFCRIAMPKRSTHKNTDTVPKILPRSANRFCKGVSSTFAAFSIPAIFPISVSIPMADTLPTPRP